MVLANSEYQDDIRLGFAVLQGYIRPGGPTNLIQINVQAEDFVAEILNAFKGWSLWNCNATRANYPCFDLIDPKLGIAVQVTAEKKGLNKINTTLKCAKAHALDPPVIQLYVFSLLKKQKTYAVKESAPGIAFSSATDVLDFDSLFAEICKSKLDVQERVRDTVVRWLPIVFGDNTKRLQAERDRVHADMTVLNRQVLQAPDEFEDPQKMFIAIREMRIELQKRGASTIGNHVAATNMGAIEAALTKCEREVFQKYRFIVDAVENRKTLTYSDYNSNYQNAISLMKGIRDQVNPRLENIRGELASLDQKLKNE